MRTNIKKLSPSIMCARNLLNIKQDIDIFKRTGIDTIHVDIMDGHFVPNVTFGPDIVNVLSNSRKSNEYALDIHMMVENPEMLLARMNLQQNDIVTIHSEIDQEILESTIAYLHEKNIKVGLALNPKTEFEDIKEYLDDIDLILVMFVEPGFAGARPMPKVINKVEEIAKYLEAYKYNDILISVDGGISLERASDCSKLGANIFVGGTSSIYGKGSTLSNKKFTDNIMTFCKTLNS